MKIVTQEEAILAIRKEGGGFAGYIDQEGSDAVVQKVARDPYDRIAIPIKVTVDGAEKKVLRDIIEAGSWATGAAVSAGLYVGTPGEFGQRIKIGAMLCRRTMLILLTAKESQKPVVEAVGFEIEKIERVRLGVLTVALLAVIQD